IVMVAAFSGFVAGSIVGLQQFGLGLAVAIFVDATIVRAILVPSLMAVFGRWNWWLPVSLARVVRVRPSPLAERGRPAFKAAERRAAGDRRTRPARARAGNGSSPPPRCAADRGRQDRRDRGEAAGPARTARGHRSLLLRARRLRRDRGTRAVESRGAGDHGR